MRRNFVLPVGLSILAGVVALGLHAAALAQTTTTKTATTPPATGTQPAGSQVVEALRVAHRLLAHADHDYDGHRASGGAGGAQGIERPGVPAPPPQAGRDWYDARRWDHHGHHVRSEASGLPSRARDDRSGRGSHDRDHHRNHGHHVRSEASGLPSRARDDRSGRDSHDRDHHRNHGHWLDSTGRV